MCITIKVVAGSQIRGMVLRDRGITEQSWCDQRGQPELHPICRVGVRCTIVLVLDLPSERCDELLAAVKV